MENIIYFIIFIIISLNLSGLLLLIYLLGFASNIRIFLFFIKIIPSLISVAQYSIIKYILRYNVNYFNLYTLVIAYSLICVVSVYVIYSVKNKGKPGFLTVLLVVIYSSFSFLFGVEYLYLLTFTFETSCIYMAITPNPFEWKLPERPLWPESKLCDYYRQIARQCVSLLEARFPLLANHDTMRYFTVKDLSPLDRYIFYKNMHKIIECETFVDPRVEVKKANLPRKSKVFFLAWHKSRLITGEY